MSLNVEKCLQAWTNSLRQMNSKADVVFFGDSLTYYGDFSLAFPDKIVCNLGLRGDTLLGMIDRVEQVQMLEPKQVFLMGGLNDVTSCDVQEFGYRYEVLVRSIIEHLKDVDLVIQSLLPVNDKDFLISCDNHQIVACNDIISRIAEKLCLKYIDLFTCYVQEEVMPKIITNDGLHLKPEAYLKWYDIIKYY